MGITTGAMCLGGTASGFMSTAVARDYGDAAAFAALGIMSLIPFLLYLFLVPETLPEYAKPQPNKRRKRLEAILQRINMQTRNLAEKNPFKRRDSSNSKLQEEEKNSSDDSSSPKKLELV